MRTALVPLATLLIAGLAAVAAAQTPDEHARTEAQRRARAGEQLMQTESWEQAAEEFRAAVALDPLLVLGHYNLGRCLMARKLYAEAQAAYEACMAALARRNQLSETERVRITREIDEQIRELQQMAKNYGGRDTTVQQRVMEIEERIRLLQQSKPTESAVVRVPPELHLALGSAFFRQKKFVEAEREYLAALETNKKLGAAYNNLAVIYMFSGRFEEARRALKQAEKAGFAVPPALKADIDKREAAAKMGAPTP